MSEALLRSREALVWNNEALELWRELGEIEVDGTRFAPVWFGQRLAVGRYRIEWVSGIVQYNPTWFTISSGNNVQVLLSAAAGAVVSGAAAIDRLLWPGLARSTTLAAALALAEAARATQYLEWEHAGGPIGMGVWDPVYADNSGGARFRLLRV